MYIYDVCVDKPYTALYIAALYLHRSEPHAHALPGGLAAPLPARPAAVKDDPPGCIGCGAEAPGAARCKAF